MLIGYKEGRRRDGADQIMKDYHNLVESGRREIYTIEG